MGATTLALALLAVQQEIEGVSKNSENGHFGNRYADLTAVLDATVPVLNKHGIVVLQTPVVPPFPDVLALETTLIHAESGESRSGTAVVPLAKSDAQGFGSAMTYTRRYSLGSILGLGFLDDDGNAASGRSSDAPAKPAGGFPGKSLPSKGGSSKGGFPKPGGKGSQAKAPERKKRGLFPTAAPADAGDESGDEGEESGSEE